MTRNDLKDYSRKSWHLTEKHLALRACRHRMVHSCLCSLCTVYFGVLTHARVKGQHSSVSDCENETVVVFLRAVDYEPLMMCTGVWLLGRLWLVRRCRPYELLWPKSVWMFDWLHCSHTIWTRLCMTLPRLVLTNHLRAWVCLLGCTEALLLFSFCVFFC